jgi:hypothetical protein
VSDAGAAASGDGFVVLRVPYRDDCPSLVADVMLDAYAGRAATRAAACSLALELSDVSEVAWELGLWLVPPLGMVPMRFASGELWLVREVACYAPAVSFGDAGFFFLVIASEAAFFADQQKSSLERRERHRGAYHLGEEEEV